jgi:hypothetical protein
VTRRVSDYIALAMISRVKWKMENSSFLDDDGISGAFDRLFHSAPNFAGDMVQLKGFAEERCGFPVSDPLLDNAVRALAECGLLRVTDDNYSGTFVKLKAPEFSGFIERANEELAAAEKADDKLSILTRPSDYPNASALMSHEIFEDYHELGDEWLMRALLGLKAQVDENGQIGESEATAELSTTEYAPASDRIVTLTDNQQSVLEESTSKLIAEIEKTNGIDGDTSFRQLVLGQLKAGRELIRSTIFDAQIMYLTLVEMLKALVKRYDQAVIGSLASALLVELAKIHGLLG